MAGQLGEGCFDFLDAAPRRIGPPEQGLGREIVTQRIEEKEAALHRTLGAAPCRRQLWIHDARAADDARQGLNVGLGVAAVDAQGVQFQQFAGEVFVEAERLAARAGALGEGRFGGGRLRVVEVKLHGRVEKAGAQQGQEGVLVQRLLQVPRVIRHEEFVQGLETVDRKVIQPEIEQHLMAGVVRIGAFQQAGGGRLFQNLAAPDF